MKLFKQIGRALLVAGFVAAGSSIASAEPYKSIPPQPVETKGKVDVIEFFWYGCPHCYHLEPALDQWLAKLPKDVQFRRIPAVWNPRMEAHAQLFYALEAMGALEKLHGKLFAATQKDKLDTHDKEVAAGWVASQGLDKGKFLAAYSSFGVESQARRAKQIMPQYKVSGVPAFIVGGKYQTSEQDAGSSAALFQTLDKLIDLERKARK